MADRKNNETTSWNADEVRRQQTQRKQRKKMRRARFWAIYCAGVVLGSCLLAGLGWLMVNDVCALNKAPLTATVEIEKGDSVGQIASKLKKAGIIKYKLLFVITSPLFHAKDTKIDEINTKTHGVLDTKHYGDEIHRSWIFRSIGYGHDELFWKDFVSQLRLVGYDYVLSIEHEDSLMSKNEGLVKACDVLKRAITFEDKMTEARWF